MKIAIVSRGDSSSGGAGRVAENLAKGLKKKGLTVFHFIQRPPTSQNRENTIYLRRIKGDILLRNLFGFDIAGIKLLFRKEIWNADIIHFHDFSVAYGILILLILSFFKKIFMTFHDFSGFTGGCLYPSNCNNYYLNQCKKCPQIGTTPLTFPFLEYPKFHFKIIKKLAKSPNLVAISPSEYIKNAAILSGWSDNKIHVIRNSVDIANFSPMMRTAGRKFMNLNDNETAILFIASNILDPRKGFQDIVEIFPELLIQNNKLKLVLVGTLERIPQELIQYSNNILMLGQIKNTEILGAIYAGSDYLIMPSYDDNMPCTIMESLSAGTPCISYDTGGIPEIFNNIPECKLVKVGNKNHLKNLIIKSCEYQLSFIHRKIISKQINIKYSQYSFCHNHIRLYSDIIANIN